MTDQPIDLTLLREWADDAISTGTANLAYWTQP